LEQLRACRKKYDESMRTYIQRWNVIKNSAENISDKRAIDAYLLVLEGETLLRIWGEPTQNQYQHSWK
jgi:hypothetical protein